MEKDLFGISHEIKNFLSVTKGYISLFDGTIEKYEKYMPFVIKSLDQSIELLNDFNSIGKNEYDLDIIDVGYLIEDVSNLYDCNLHLCDELYIKGDYKRLKEVLINILKNSSDAGASKIDIFIYSEKKKIVIKVVDDGIGMGKDILKEIGKPFFTTKQMGTGLGVYISKKIIEDHHGILLYKSIPMKGTKAIIKLDQYNLV